MINQVLIEIFRQGTQRTEKAFPINGIGAKIITMDNEPISGGHFGKELFIHAFIIYQVNEGHKYYLPPTEEITVTPSMIAFSPIMVVKFLGSI